MCERTRNGRKKAQPAQIESSPGARPSGRFTDRMEVNETIDLRAGDAEAA
jgi:hypothetical protein